MALFKLFSKRDEPEEERIAERLTDESDDDNEKQRSESDKNRRSGFKKQNVRRFDRGDSRHNSDSRANKENRTKVKRDARNETYVDLLDDFLKDYEEEDFLTIAEKFETCAKNLKTEDLDEKFKSDALKKLCDIEKIVNSKINILKKSENALKERRNEGNERRRNEADDSGKNVALDKNKFSEFNSLNSSKVTDNKSKFASLLENPRSSLFSDTESVVSNVSISRCASKSTAVHCQFCEELLMNDEQLINHLDFKCEKFRFRNFPTNRKFPFSYYQILPSGKIKCNACNIVLRNFDQKLDHDNIENHQKEIKRTNPRKETTHFIFCSCCKVNVPNNHIQLNMHLQNEEHRELSKSRGFDKNKLFESGFSFVIRSRNKMNCLICDDDRQFIVEGQNFENHLNQFSHQGVLKQIDNYEVKIFCAHCERNVTENDARSHISSDVHRKNAQENKDSGLRMKNVYCFFCNGKFPDLKNLAVHLDCSCAAMNAKRPKKTQQSNRTQQQSPANQFASRNPFFKNLNTQPYGSKSGSNSSFTFFD